MVVVSILILHSLVKKRWQRASSNGSRSRAAAQTSYNQLSNQLEQHYVVSRQYQKQLDDLSEELGEHATTEAVQIQAELQSAHEKLQRLTAIDIAQLEKNVEQLNQRCVVGETKINELQNQMAANESTIKANQDQLSKLLANIDPKYGSVEVLEQEITQTKEQIQRLNNNLKVHSRSFNKRC